MTGDSHDLEYEYVYHHVVSWRVVHIRLCLTLPWTVELLKAFPTKNFVCMYIYLFILFIQSSYMGP